jgi:WD40 repeat protein
MAFSRRAKIWLWGLGATGGVLGIAVVVLILLFPRVPSIVSTYYIAHGGNVNRIAFLPNGQHFLSAGWDERVLLWNRNADANGDVFPVHSFAQVGGPLHDLVLSSDGKRFYAVGQVSAVVRGSLPDIKVLPSFPIPAPAKHIALSPDGKTLAVGGSGECFLLLDAASGAIRCQRKLPGSSSFVTFSPNGKWLAVAALEAVLLCDPRTGEEKHRLSLSRPSLLRFSPDGKNLAVSGFYSPLTIWQPDTNGTPIHRFPHPVMDLVFSADSTTFYTVEKKSVLRRTIGTDAAPKCVTGYCRDPDKPRWLTRTLPFLGPPHKEHFASLTLSPDGKDLLYASDSMIKRIQLSP